MAGRTEFLRAFFSLCRGDFCTINFLIFSNKILFSRSISYYHFSCK